MASKNILVIDGNTEETNRTQHSFGGSATGEGYGETLTRIAPETTCVIARPAYEDYHRASVSLEGLDGAVITGSALHVMDPSPQVQNQIDLVADVFNRSIPVFGSCWGLQLACVVLGGTVSPSPHGLEVGIVEDVCLTKEGLSHPLFEGKPACLEVMSIHSDEVSAVPEGARVLAQNGHSPVQALEVVRGGKVFWGVQYHPEFGPRDMAAIYQRYRERFLAQGVYPSLAAVDQRIEAFQSMARQEDAGTAEKRLCRGVAHFQSRTREIANWLHWLGREPRL